MLLSILECHRGPRSIGDQVTGDCPDGGFDSRCGTPIRCVEALWPARPREEKEADRVSAHHEIVAASAHDLRMRLGKLPARALLDQKGEAVEEDLRA